MTETLAAVFTDDPCAAVLRVLRSAGTPLGVGEIKATLVSAGLARAEVDKRWAVVQKRLKESPQVLAEGRLYRWVDQPAVITAIEALDLLSKGHLTAARRAALADIVRAAFDVPGLPPTRPDPPDEDEAAAPAAPSRQAEIDDQRQAAARLRQAEIDGLRALGELAGEVEELVANGVEPAVLVRRVRARVKRGGLEPIDRAGEQTAFDRKIHAPIGGPIRDGASVIVVRPGYTWSQSGTDLLISKAVVEE